MPVPQREPDVPVGTAGKAFTTIVIGSDNTVDSAKHPVSLEVISTVNASSFINNDVVYVELFSPSRSTSFSFHW